ncbi:MAG: hypothetical protein PHF08_12900 [Candidatus Riflebacteria bacterium]|nr:hypothetical protein [Candidatus Riflebacteria bacterium]
MAAENATKLADELKKYRKICYYPSSGTDLSDLDYFGSGKLLWDERVESGRRISNIGAQNDDLPDLFVHSDINFYMEFEEGKDLDADECGLHGSYEVTGFRELPRITSPNRICDNYDFSGRCFEYKLKVWGINKELTLIYCLCENEFFVSEILLAHGIKVDYIWSKNWAGGLTTGTWLANVCKKLNTKKFFTDWLCVPGKKGQPLNSAVKEKYPLLMIKSTVKLIRSGEPKWIDEGANGWVEEYDVTK